MPSCAICSIEASSDKVLRMHIQAKHDERVLKCEKCEVTCKGGGSLRHTWTRIGKSTANTVTKEFPTIVGTVTQLKCVGEKKAFKCENCPATFNKADNLKVHMTNKRCSVQCNLCEKTLQSEFYLEKHISSTQRVQMNLVDFPLQMSSEMICIALTVILWHQNLQN